jgi:hypothetical protein
MAVQIEKYHPSDYEAVWDLHQKTIKENAGFVKNLSFHTSITTTIGYQANFIHRDADEALDAVVGKL